MHTKPLPTDWDPIGMGADVASTTTDRVFVMTTKSGHVQFFKEKDTGLVDIRLIMFRPGSERALDLNVHWDLAEVGMAMDIDGYRLQINPSFAIDRGAEMGVEDKFVRTDNYLVIYCKDHTGRMAIRLSFYLHEHIKRKFATFLGS